MKKRTPDPKDTEALAPWHGVDPRRILAKEPGDDELASFVLALAVVFNDLKDGLFVMMSVGRLLGGDTAHITPQAAEYGGMLSHALRWQCGLLQELMNLIRAHKNLVESGPFRSRIAGLPPEARTAWKDLVDVALTDGVTREDRKSRTWILGRIRNQVGFHYSAHAFAEGYRHHFFDAAPSPYNKRAVFSDGKSMEGTRFNFADAAGQGAFTSLTALTLQGVMNLVGDVATSTNLALRHIVIAFLRSENRRIEPFIVGS